MHFCIFFYHMQWGHSAQDHWQGGKVCSCLGWWVWIACPSSLGLIHTTHTLSHTHTHLSHTTHPLTHPHTHRLMHPNKHASHTRQMCWWWRCSRRKESHSPSCLGVQSSRVLETSISNKYVTARTQVLYEYKYLSNQLLPISWIEVPMQA